jgi:cytochrome c biogenesis protein CcmG/thiol:disulfide interchange protein DsbE
VPGGDALLQKVHQNISGRGGVVLGVDTQDASSKALEFLAQTEGDVPEPARPRPPHIRAGLRRDGISGDVPDRPQGRVAAPRRQPVAQAWLDQRLPKLLEEKA